MKRLLFIVAVVSVAFFGLHGAVMALMDMPMDMMMAADHIMPVAPACPLGDICPLFSSTAYDQLPMPSPLLLSPALSIVGAVGVMLVARKMHFGEPLPIFANTGPPIILKTIKRE